ncbi:unnamed protein product [Polarella glacialis]|uniref:Uncharacterized protein n=1 Tax=Polarella glacialis TaxID=89957 RepID=A0A813EVZ3_POLGL|nr:unnamed protein product [Polarella glacialis]CAE8717407.1 unnamed protein product [Polarella glacialis]
MAEFRDRLRGMGVVPPMSNSSDAEGWRLCLVELCRIYLGSDASDAAGSEQLSLAAKESLPGDLQLAALLAKAEVQRQRNFELRRELDFAARREALLQTIASQDPVIGMRSLEDFVRVLERVRDGCEQATAAIAGGLPPERIQVSSETDLADLLSTLQASREGLVANAQ